MVSALVLGSVIFRATVDDVDNSSSQLTGKDIRQSLYGILGCRKATETMRSGGIDMGVEPCVDPSCPDTALISHDKSTLERRQSVFCSILHCSRKEIDRLPLKWQLVVIVSSYWFKIVKPYIPPYIAETLVFTFLACSQGHCPSRLERVSAPSLRKNHSPQALHAFAQWQSVYFDALSLNQLLQEPFQYITPSHLYDGEIAMHYMHM